MKMRGFEDKDKEKKKEEDKDNEKNKDEDKKKNEDEDVEQIQGMSNWGAGGSLFKGNTHVLECCCCVHISPSY